MPTDPTITTDRTTPRVLLFGHPKSGKTHLLGALLRAGQTQGDVLGGEILDPTHRLDQLRDAVYSGADIVQTRTEVATYPVRLRPWRVGRRAVSDPLTVVLTDCDGTAATALLKRVEALSERRVRGAVASAVLASDLIALVVDAGIGDEELNERFEDFLFFLQEVHGRKTREREVGGFPIFVVLSQCDELAEPGDTRGEWEARVRGNLKHVVRRFAEFLDEQNPESDDDSPYLPFGSVDVRGYAVAVRWPAVKDDPHPPDEPFGVAELFRDAFAAARTHRNRALASNRRLLTTVWAVAFAVWGLLTGAVAVSIFQPPPADPGLADRVRGYETHDGPAAVRLAEKHIARNKRALESFRADPGFFSLPDDLRAFVDGRLREIEDYQAYRDKLLAAPAPADARTLEELDHAQTVLTTELAQPAEYTWADTEAGRLREKWLADAPLIRAAEAGWHEWYRGLVNQATAATLTRAFDADWRGRVGGLDTVADRPPFDVAAVIPGSEAVRQPRGDAVTYRVPHEFDRVYQARRDWDFARSRLLHLRDLADALGLTPNADNPLRRVLVVPPPGPGVDAISLPGERLAALRQQFPRPSPLYPRPDAEKDGPDAGRIGLPVYPEWELANFPEPGRTLLANQARASFGNGVRQVRELILSRLGPVPASDTPSGWGRVADGLDGPPFGDWGRLLQVLARLENPAAANPVDELAAFLRTRPFDIDLKGLDLAIPLALRVPQLVPTGPVVVTITPPAGTPVTPTFRPSGDGTQQGLVMVYRFAGDAPFVYRPGDALRVEVPVRSGDERWTLAWTDGGTQTFQFDRFGREPRLTRPGTAPEPATGVTLTPTAGSALPPVPVLLPDVRR